MWLLNNHENGQCIPVEMNVHVDIYHISAINPFWQINGHYGIWTPNIPKLQNKMFSSVVTNKNVVIY